MSLRYVLLAGVPLTLLFAALSPRHFTPARLATLAAIAMVLVAGEQMTSILSLLDSMPLWSAAFWETITRPDWLNLSALIVACSMAAAVLLAAAAARLRSGRSATPGVCASWLLLLLVLWLHLTTWGFWWDPHGMYSLSTSMHVLRITSSLAYVLMEFCLGLAFLLPLYASGPAILTNLPSPAWRPA